MIKTQPHPYIECHKRPHLYTDVTTTTSIIGCHNNHIHIPDVTNIYPYIIHTPGDTPITQSYIINVYHSPLLPYECIQHINNITINVTHT